MNGALSKAQPPVLNAQSCLVPDPVWNWEAANGFEAGAHFSIEGHQCCTVEPSGGGAHVCTSLVKDAQCRSNCKLTCGLSSSPASKTFPAFCTLSERVAWVQYSLSPIGAPRRSKAAPFTANPAGNSCSLEGSQRGSDRCGPSSDHNVIHR